MAPSDASSFRPNTPTPANGTPKPPLSARKAAANRANAAKSTGPRTAEGKAKSSCNALVHGLTARCALLPGEDPADYRAFERRMLADLRPLGAVQALLAEQIVQTGWRLRRVPAAEAAVIDHLVRAPGENWEGLEQTRRELGFTQLMFPPPPKPPPLDDQGILVGRFIKAKSEREEPVGRVEAHALRLQKTLLSLLKALHRLQEECGRAEEGVLVQNELTGGADAVQVPAAGVPAAEPQGSVGGAGEALSPAPREEQNEPTEERSATAPPPEPTPAVQNEPTPVNVPVSPATPNEAPVQNEPTAAPPAREPGEAPHPGW